MTEGITRIVDEFGNVRIITRYSEDQERDENGRFGSGGGGGVSAPAGPIIESNSSRVAVALLSGQQAKIAPEHVDALMKQMAGGPHCNMENLQVTGQGNEHCFAEHAREIPRQDMPQLPESAEGLKGFTDRLAAEGLTTEMRSGVDPRSLTATQNELDASKVGTLYGYIRSSGWREDTVVITAQNGEVLDGHHRWAAASAAVMAGQDIKLNTLVVNTDIDRLLSLAAGSSLEHRGLDAGLGGT